eukprot:gnl/MRDRNA2_/MRDRNA2_122138_c0_seq1.p1 gnl/MRDRNA2_/MRDRNA2_122138_c0~~gnl/MRDRNA2_/MRDRNA2_122138_c0_seq1.p1  ORF type:complete len:346 (-),score=48.83 gnl/MRDRNA2_/MRDRNA2_122138_c0_seq1:308-1345(-)
MRMKSNVLKQLSSNFVMVRCPKLLLHSRGWLLLLQISALSCGSVEATNRENEHVKADIQCLNLNRCFCCFYTGENGTVTVQHDGYHSNQTAYCGKHQCDSHYLRYRQHKAKRFSSKPPMLIFSVLFATVMLVIGVKLAHRSYMKSKRIERLKVRQVEICKHLDAKIPSMLYGNDDDLECQRDEGELCCVCLDELEGALVRKLHCNHILHKDCFDRWCLHLSDINCDQGGEQKKPKESLWACPLCKHPAVPDLEQSESISSALSTRLAQSQLQSQASDGSMRLFRPTGSLDISQTIGDLPTLLCSDRHIIAQGSPAAQKVSLPVSEYGSMQSSPKMVSSDGSIWPE